MLHLHRAHQLVRIGGREVPDVFRDLPKRSNPSCILRVTFGG
jgi:hypothetical protein